MILDRVLVPKRSDTTTHGRKKMMLEFLCHQPRLDRTNKNRVWGPNKAEIRLVFGSSIQRNGVPIAIDTILAIDTKAGRHYHELRRPSK